MEKKLVKKSTKQRAPEPSAKHSGRVYPVEPEELEVPQQQIRKLATAGAETLKVSAPTVKPVLNPAPETAPPKPLTPLAALWPSTMPAQEASKPVPTSVRQVEMARVKGPAPQNTPAPETPAPNPPLQAEPERLPLKSASAAEAALPSAPPRPEVTFVLLAAHAKHVALSGEFNSWSPDASPMKRTLEGRWETTVELSPGRYQYKFLADGQWITDPLAHENICNQHGTFNSVIEVRA